MQNLDQYIRIEFDNGAVWGIPLREIAHHRAEYYATKDPDTTYQEEFDYVMNDEYEGIDWFKSNMFWSEVSAEELQGPREFLPNEHLYDENVIMKIDRMKVEG